MAGLDHSHLPPDEPRDPVAEQHNARLGLVLFAVYLLGYGTYVLSTPSGRPSRTASSGASTWPSPAGWG